MEQLPKLLATATPLTQKALIYAMKVYPNSWEKRYRTLINAKRDVERICIEHWVMLEFEDQNDLLCTVLAANEEVGSERLLAMLHELQPDYSGYELYKPKSP